jgi:integrase
VLRFNTIKTDLLPRCCHEMKVSISKCKVRGLSKWRVRWREAGRIHRKFFTGRDGAESFAATLREDLLSKRKQLLALPQADVEKLLLVHSEAQKRGVDLSGLLTLLQSTKDAPAAHSIREVIAEMESIKRKAGRANDYLNSLKSIADAFCKGRESLDVSKFTVGDVERFLDSKNIESRSTLRSRLSTLFKFAVRRGYRVDNPCDQLEAVTPPHKPPAIFTLAEVKKCLDWLKLNPRSLAWFALSTFAGLRPEEAEQTTWRDINFTEGWIKVEAQTTKVRQRRVVYPLPCAMDWLAFAKKKKSILPLSLKQRTKDRKKLRAVLGWKAWKQDVTRHTAASMWLAHSGSTAAVATALGHSESVLRKNYMALVTKAEAEKFWGCYAASQAAPSQMKRKPSSAVTTRYPVGAVIVSRVAASAMTGSRT